MKKNTILFAKRTATFFAAAALMISTTTAQPLTASNKQLPAEPLNVKYIGADDDYLTFEVTVTTGDIKHSELHIEEASAGSLYTARLKGNSIVETIKIEKQDEQDLRFELTAGKETYYKSFSINTSLIEKTNVSEGSFATKY